MVKNMGFHEHAYLSANPDVADAVDSGRISSGLQHYLLHGRSEGRKTEPPHRPVFFCHIPKTAGTSVSRALERQFQPPNTLPDEYMIFRHRGLYPPAHVFADSLRYQGSSVRLVRGHYHVSLASLLANPITITVLREPVARTISHIKDGVRNGMAVETVYKRLDAGQMPVEANLMTRYLGGRSGGLLSNLLNKPTYTPLSGRLDETAVEGAIKRLPSITCLGVVERMPEFLTRLKTTLGIDFDLQHQNAGDVDISLSEKQRQIIARHNDLDLRLYEAAVEEIERR